MTENPNIELVLAISRRVVEELKYRHGAQIIGEETRGSVRLFYREVLGKKLIGWNKWPRFMPPEARQRVGEIAADASLGRMPR